METICWLLVRNFFEKKNVKDSIEVLASIVTSLLKQTRLVKDILCKNISLLL